MTRVRTQDSAKRKRDESIVFFFTSAPLLRLDVGHSISNSIAILDEYCVSFNPHSLSVMSTWYGNVKVLCISDSSNVQFYFDLSSMI